MTQPSPHAGGKFLVAILIGGFAASLLIAHAITYYPLFIDDAYISLRYAMRFLHGQGLTWSDGQVVEGYSNFLWVMLCAALGSLGLDLVTAARALGLLSGVLTTAAFVFAYPPRTWTGSLPALAGALFIALAGPIAIWAIAGLEDCLVAALLAWGFVLLRPLLDGAEPTAKAVLLPGAPLALLSLTRPDAPLLVVAICAFLLIRTRPLRKGLVAALGVGLLPGLATLGQLVFRLLYYGDWVPNTARAKVALTSQRLFAGMECVQGALSSSYALAVPAALAAYVAWRDPTRRSRILLAATMLVVWTGYTISVTCWQFGYRMLIPSFVLLAFLVAETLDWVVGQGRAAARAAWVGALVALLVFGWAQQKDRNISLARNDWTRSLTRKGASIGLGLRRAFAALDPLVAVDAAGAIPYYSQLRSLDMLGLNDAHIARQRPPEFGRGTQGHELGDGDYILARRPDIIIGGILGSPELSYLGGRQMMADPRFGDEYRLAVLSLDDPVRVRSSIYIRLEGRVGIERSDDAIRIPGYLFASTQGADARFDASGTLGTLFADGVTVQLAEVDLTPGVWRFETEGTGHLALTVRKHSEDETASGELSILDFAIDEAGAVDVGVTGGPNAFLRSVNAVRREERSF
jgi:arabinofuranosyltransferase